jgi:hypothetical protein
MRVRSLLLWPRIPVAGRLRCRPRQLMRAEAPTADGRVASGAPETQDNVERLDIIWLSTDPYDVEDEDQLRIPVKVETQDAAIRPEHGFT